MEARLTIDLLTLFHNIWSNRETKVFNLVHYIMKMSKDNSTTWSNHVRIICKLYGLPDPLALLQQQPMTKQSWKTLVQTKISAFHELQLKREAVKNPNMEYFNVQLSSLSGLPHPALRQIMDSREAYKLKAHLKFLVGDVLSSAKLSRERGGDPRCRLCQAPYEDTTHILVDCVKTAETRHRLLPELLNLVADIQPHSELLDSQKTTSRELAQFVVDPSSFNLPSTHRISFQHPRLSDLYRLSRDWCFAIHNSRAKLLNQL